MQSSLQLTTSGLQSLGLAADLLLAFMFSLAQTMVADSDKMSNLCLCPIVRLLFRSLTLLVATIRCWVKPLSLGTRHARICKSVRHCGSTECFWTFQGEIGWDATQAYLHTHYICIWLVCFFDSRSELLQLRRSHAQEQPKGWSILYASQTCLMLRMMQFTLEMQ